MIERWARVVPWLLRIWWTIVGVAGSEALDQALADTDDGVRLVLTAVLAVAWVAAAGAMFWLAVPTLTLLRAIVPLSIPLSALAAGLGGAAGPSTVALIASLLATATVFLPEIGRAFVQASAYGDEDRHLLRPPAAFLAAAVVSWLLSAGLVVAGIALAAEGSAVVGLVLLFGGVALGIWASRRWHRLSRRWLVVVPAGLVLHDHLVLAETLMVRRVDVAGVALAQADTQAADLTGPAGGHALEVTTRTSVTAIRAGTPRQPGGSAIHLTAYLIAPTRPGQALRAATRRGDP